MAEATWRSLSRTKRTWIWDGGFCYEAWEWDQRVPPCVLDYATTSGQVWLQLFSGDSKLIIYLSRGLHEHHDSQTWSASTAVNCSCHVFYESRILNDAYVYVLLSFIWMRTQKVRQQMTFPFIAHSCFLYNSSLLSPNGHSFNNKRCVIYRIGNLLCHKQQHTPTYTVHWGQISWHDGQRSQ